MWDGFSSPGYASAAWPNPRPSPLAETLRAGALFPSLSARAAACACLSSAVAGQSPAAVARLVRDDVLEHVFEVLRDAGRARSAAEAPGRTAHALAETRGAADAAGRAALACLMDVLRAAAPDPEAARACSTRMVLGMDVLSATLARSAQTRDTETVIAATRLARAVAELGDPGNVPGTAAGRLADALLDAYDALPVSNDAGSARADRAFVEYEYVPPVTSGGGVASEPVAGFRRQVPTGACAARRRARRSRRCWRGRPWRTPQPAPPRGATRAGTSARAARVFERLARDVTRNLRGFGAEEDARDGVPAARVAVRRARRRGRVGRARVRVGPAPGRGGCDGLRAVRPLRG